MMVMNRLGVGLARVGQGPYHEAFDQDGIPYVRFNYVVHVEVPTDPDHEYTFGRDFPTRAGAEVFAARVTAIGSIDPAQWGTRMIYGSRAWVSEGCEQNEIRREREEGYGW